MPMVQEPFQLCFVLVTLYCFYVVLLPIISKCLKLIVKFPLSNKAEFLCSNAIVKSRNIMFIHLIAHDEIFEKKT